MGPQWLSRQFAVGVITNLLFFYEVTGSLGCLVHFSPNNQRSQFFTNVYQELKNFQSFVFNQKSTHTNLNLPHFHKVASVLSSRKHF